MSVLLYGITVCLNAYWLANTDRLHDVTQLVIPVVSVLLIAAGVLLRLDRLPVHERSAYKRKALLVLLVYYGTLVCSVVFFGGLFGMERGWGGAVNLEPFYSIRRYLIHYRRTGSLYSLFNLAGNVLLLVPLGVLLPAVFGSMRRWWLCVPVLAAVSTGVELLQWHFGVGVADVDDSILNFFGALLGYLAFMLLSGAIRWMRGKL